MSLFCPTFLDYKIVFLFMLTIYKILFNYHLTLGMHLNLYIAFL